MVLSNKSKNSVTNMKNVERTAQVEGIAEEKEGESSDHKDKQKMRGPKKERMVHIHILRPKKA